MSKTPRSSENAPYVPDITLDRSSPVPLYFQISEPIAQLINSGALPADTRLEDELSMAARQKAAVDEALECLSCRGARDVQPRRHR